MLLNLRIQGFKNLRDVKVRFGPLTCFVGPNGVGKSNLFDAIQFLRHLADGEIERAAEAIRQPAQGGFGPLDLFWNRDIRCELQLTAEMAVPPEVEDDFGKRVNPTATLLHYGVTLGYSPEEHRLVLKSEKLVHLKKSDARAVFGFPHSVEFRRSLVQGKRYGTAFISTSATEGILLHGDGGSRGRPVLPGPSPRTVLAGTGTADYPTVLAARREMASWHSLHLEPSSLRTPDRLGEREPIDEHGKHIAATLLRVSSNHNGANHSDTTADQASARTEVARKTAAVYQAVANELARLVPGVRAVRVEQDPVREQCVVQVRMRDSELWLPPRSLSDGTLRYLALAVMQMDPRASRLLCIEEPENGIHVFQVPTLVQLLRDYAVDPQLGVAEDNPARQLILNSHSPEVVKQLLAEEILFVESVNEASGRVARVRPLDAEGNWRGTEGAVPMLQLEQWMGGAPRSQGLLPFGSG